MSGWAQPPELVHILSIPDFNADDHIELMLDKPRCIDTAQGSRSSIKALSGHGKYGRFDLQIFHEPGKNGIQDMSGKR
jgi:hypothetical protein